MFWAYLKERPFQEHMGQEYCLMKRRMADATENVL
jgi:hypothetical protein